MNQEKTIATDVIRDYNRKQQHPTEIRGFKFYYVATYFRREADMKLTETLRLAERVNYLGVQSYLKNTGWVKQRSNREDVAIFTIKHHEEELEIVLPLTREFADYNNAIVDAITTIASYENKEISQVLSDLI